MDKNRDSSVPIYDDEIDLVQLFKVFWQHKYEFVSVVFASLILALIYLFLIAKPIYQSSYYFSEPSLADITNLNYHVHSPVLNSQSNLASSREMKLNNISVVAYTTTEILNRFQNNLLSINNREEFLKTETIYDTFRTDLNWMGMGDFESNKDRLIQFFSESLNTDCSNQNIQRKLFKNKEINPCLSFNYSNPTKAANILNQFIDHTQAHTINQLIEIRKTQINNDVVKLENQIKNLMQVYESNKQLRMEELREAIEVAQQSGIENSMINEADNRFNMEYMRGTKALQAELDTLINRKNDKLFISGLVELEAQLAELKSIHFEGNQIKAIKTELRATESQKIKPKKSIILLIALLLGGFLGLVFIFIRRAFNQH